LAVDAMKTLGMSLSAAAWADLTDSVVTAHDAASKLAVRTRETFRLWRGP
jgi:hypothetical protein